MRKKIDKEKEMERFLRSEMRLGGAGPRVLCNLCGDIIQSTHRHHMCFCKCGKVAIDGGSSYVRMMFTNSPDDYKILKEEDGSGEPDKPA